MSTEPSAPPPESGSNEKKRGCLFWVLVVAALSVAVVAGGGYFGYRYVVHRIVANYTETAPRDLGEPAFDELGQLDGRLASFAHAVRNKRPAPPLVLTGDELTALIARSPDFQRSGGRARLAVAAGEIRADLSVPLARMGYADRWFNGAATFTVGLENGVLIVTLKSATVRGEPVPSWLLRAIGEKNLAADLYEKPDVAGFLSRIESIETADGRLTIVPRVR